MKSEHYYLSFLALQLLCRDLKRRFHYILFKTLCPESSIPKWAPLGLTGAQPGPTGAYIECCLRAADQGRGPGGAGAPTHWQCAATLHYRGFPHSLADHHGAHMSKRQLPLHLSPSHPAPSPLAVLPLHLPLCAPSQPFETIKTPCMGEGV